MSFVTCHPPCSPTIVVTATIVRGKWLHVHRHAQGKPNMLQYDILQNHRNKMPFSLPQSVKFYPACSVIAAPKQKLNTGNWFAQRHVKCCKSSNFANNSLTKLGVLEKSLLNMHSMTFPCWIFWKKLRLQMLPWFYAFRQVDIRLLLLAEARENVMSHHQISDITLMYISRKNDFWKMNSGCQGKGIQMSGIKLSQPLSSPRSWSFTVSSIDTSYAADLTKYSPDFLIIYWQRVAGHPAGLT